MASFQEKVELFHLLFLDQFGQKMEKGLYALKGGCNLRFFFKSMRYSEDIDFDIHTVGVGTLAKKVDKILESVALSSILRSHNLELAEITKPKQTETVQRWKLAVVEIKTRSSARTKIEFSRRKFDKGVQFDPVDSGIVFLHKIHSVLANHYSLDTALKQKLEALAGRSETQARDVFDIDLLLRCGAKSLKLSPAAIKAVASISFDDFKSQVVAYLEPNHQSQYGSREMWKQILSRVTGGIL